MKQVPTVLSTLQVKMTPAQKPLGTVNSSSNYESQRLALHVGIRLSYAGHSDSGLSTGKANHSSETFKYKGSRYTYWHHISLTRRIFFLQKLPKETLDYWFILHTTGPEWVVLPISEGLLDHAKLLQYRLQRKWTVATRCHLKGWAVPLVTLLQVLWWWEQKTRGWSRDITNYKKTRSQRGLIPLEGRFILHLASKWESLTNGLYYWNMTLLTGLYWTGYGGGV